MIFGKVFVRLSRKLKLVYYNKTYVKILAKTAFFNNYNCVEKGTNDL